MDVNIHINPPFVEDAAIIPDFGKGFNPPNSIFQTSFQFILNDFLVFLEKKFKFI
jgi:hypothetical protein